MIEITLTVEMQLKDGSSEEVEVTVCGTFYAGSPSVMYLSNGDPGHPAEPDEVEILSATLPDGTPWELNEAQQRKAEEKIIEKASEDRDDDDGSDYAKDIYED
jgi:hypothetical protein